MVSTHNQSRTHTERTGVIFMQEIWKNVTIDGFEDYYAVSNLGNVKKLCRYRKGGLSFEEQVMKQQTDSNGYKKVTFSVLGKRKTVHIHKLVACAFIVNKNDYPCINHIDGNKHNNCVENLEWCTIEYNTKHAHKNNLIPKPKTIAVYQFDLKGNRLKKWNSMSYASKKTGIHISDICACCRKIKISSGGFIWSYEPKININDPFFSKIRPRRKVLQYDLNKNLISKYNSCQEAAIAINGNRNSINNCCLGNAKTSKGYIWEYE